MADFTPMDLARFWSRVAPAPDFQCWEWRGQRTAKGYGRFRGDMAHRIAYTLAHGPIPEGQIIRHKCDNPPCCNPKHLEPGAHADNARDCIERDRFLHGERSPTAKLSAEQALYILRNPDKLRVRDLAQRFNVSPATVSLIRSGQRWRRLG